MFDNKETLYGALATIVATLFIKHLKIDNLLYGPIHTITLGIFANVIMLKTHFFDVIDKITNEIIFNNVGYLMMILSMMVIIYILTKKYNSTIMKLFDIFESHNMVVITDGNSLKKLADYVNENKSIFSTNNKIYYGDPELICNSYVNENNVSDAYTTINYCFPEKNRKLYFIDDKLCVSGYLVFSNYERTGVVKDQRITNQKIIASIYINKTSKMTAQEYYEYIINLKVEKKITSLYHVKMYKVKNVGIINQLNCFEKCDEYNQNMNKNMNKNIINNRNRNINYIDNFFHDKKEELMEIIDDVHFHPEYFEEIGQEAKCGFILHGPPGSGKSNFVFRLAKYLNRHIISIDLKSLSKYDVLMNIKMPVVQKYVDPSDVIFLFDEFDEAVIELNKRQNVKDKYYNDIKNLSLFSLIKNSDKDKNENDTNKDQNQDSKTCKSNHDDDSDDDHNDNLNKYMTINDLLELFAGSVPIKGAIFIATTNKLDEIEKICPALVRYGRLTPYLFDNFNGKILNEIGSYYFKKSFEFNDDDFLSITNAQVMDIIRSCIKKSTSFEEKFNKAHKLLYSHLKKKDS